MPPDFLFFDLGRVLLDFCHDRMVRQMAAVAEVSEAAMRQALMPAGEPTRGDVQWRFESGLVSEDAYFEHLCETLGVVPDPAALDRAASDIFTPIDLSMRLVEDLAAAGLRRGRRSNTNPVLWRFFMNGRYPTLNRVFEPALGSFHLRSMKPDAAIYEAAAARVGVAPERIFFTDDRAENVEAAKAHGWDAVVFTGAGSLRRELAARGVDC